MCLGTRGQGPGHSASTCLAFSSDHFAPWGQAAPVSVAPAREAETERSCRVLVEGCLVWGFQAMDAQTRAESTQKLWSHVLSPLCSSW